jgi:hypothetical protein
MANAKKKPAPAAVEPAPAPVVVLPEPPAPVVPDHTPLDGCFELDARTVARYVKAIIGAASTDQGRPILTGVYVDANGERLIMVATDSYRLYRITHPWRGDAASSGAVSPCRAIVPASWLSRVVRGHRWYGNEPLRVTFGLGRVTATYRADDLRQESMSTESIVPSAAVGYPNFEPLFTSALSADKVQYPAAFNPEYLGAALRAAKLFRGAGGNAPVRLHGIDPLKASLFTVIADDGTNAVFDMLLMPVRVPT